MSVSSVLLAAQPVEVGGYINIWKCLALVAVLVVWLRLMTWTDKDAIDAHLPREPLNIGFMFGVVLVLAAFFYLPGFLIAFPVFCAIFIAEIATYLIIRNQKVGLKDLNKQFKEWLAGLKPKSKSKIGAKGEIVLSSKSGIIEVPEGDDVQAEIAGYNALQEIFTEPLREHADRVEVAALEEKCTVRYFVDGMPYEGALVGRADASMAIKMLKESMGLDTADRRKPQTGVMKASIAGEKHEMKIVTAGSTAGESLIAEIDWKHRHDLKVDQLGFTPDQLQVVQDTIADPAGIVLLVTPKAQGLTTLEYAFLRSQDAFLTHIQTVERAPEVELEGITQNELPARASGQEEYKQVNWVVSQEPDVIMAARVDDPRSAMDLVKFAGKGKRAYVGLRAGSAFEALDVWRKLVGDDKLAMKEYLKLIVAGRVLRKLCEACKIDYVPDPDQLRKMNMQPERVAKLYTVRTTPLKDSRGNTVVCEFCLDLRFKGRTGIYELFSIDDEVRAAIQQGGRSESLKMLFKKQKRRYLQEIALQKAVAGDTSLHEVARVLKPERPSGGTSSGRPSTGGGTPRPTSGGQPSTRSTKSVPPSTSSVKKSAPPAPKA